MTEQRSDSLPGNLSGSYVFRSQDPKDSYYFLEILKWFQKNPAKVREFDRGKYFPEEDDPDRYVIEAVTTEGTKRFRGATLEDAQSGPLHDVRASDSAVDTGSGGHSDEACPHDCWSRIRDQGSDMRVRIEALKECVSVDADSVSSYVVQEVSREDIDDRWRNALIFATEDLQFRGSAERQTLKQRLLGFASRLRKSVLLDDEQAVWSAMRSAASLMSFPEVEQFLPLLASPEPVDTRLVALQCIVRMAESAGPATDHRPSVGLLDRITELGRKFLDPDLLIPGDNAAIAQNAIHALAVLGGPASQALVKQVKALDKPWLTRQLRSKFQGTVDAWDDRSGSSTDRPKLSALQGLRAALE